MASVTSFTQVHYPDSDGKPMGETDLHRKAMIRHIEVLEEYFRGQQVYVSGNLLVYYQQGNPSKYVAPDAFVVKGIPGKERRNYKIWVEGKAPDVVVETTSRKTRRKDIAEKPALYAAMGVKEYFLFDPDQEYLDPPLQGYRFVAGQKLPIEPDQAGCLVSAELGLRLCLAAGEVQFYRLDTGERLLTAAERAAAAEAELARLREELQRRQG